MIVHRHTTIAGTRSTASPEPTDDRPGPTRIGCAALTLLTGLLAVLGLYAGAGRATALGESAGPDHSPAAQTILELVGDRPERAAATAPADFATVMGYRPVAAGGLTINPEGSCSSPIGLPDRFEPLCRAHDFGYDVLRYADRTRRPLGSWARRALDRTLIRQMHAACTDVACHAAAETARTGLSLNSWRQRFGPPVRSESLLSVGTSLAGATAGLWTAPARELIGALR